MSLNNIPPKFQTDTVLQGIKLYVEGVQIPFISITISNSLGMLPQASITIPPQAGILEITRFYNPKVHVFFTDPVDGQDKVLFNGIITNSTFNKSSTSSSVTFQCAHRYQFLTEFLLDFTDPMTQLTTPRAVTEQGVKSVPFSSKHSIALAMTGIFRDSSLQGNYVEVTQENMDKEKQDRSVTTSPAVLPASLTEWKNRLVGIPGILLNMWNQQKQYAYRDNDNNEIMKKLYIPLVEEGLQFFKRMAGHYYIEDKVEGERVDPCIDQSGTEAKNKPRLVAAGHRIFLKSAVQAEVSVQLLSSLLQYSGEVVDILTVFYETLNGMNYEMVYLNSPAEVPKNPELSTEGLLVKASDGTYGVDVVVKPQIPFYFSPICNVIYPNMITSITVAQDDYNIPTRINVKNQELPNEGDIAPTNFRAPASIREAIALFTGTTTKQVQTSTPVIAGSKEYIDAAKGKIKDGTRKTNEAAPPATEKVKDATNQTLRATLASDHGRVGKYEKGRGIKFEKMLMPKWLSYFANSQFRDLSNNAQGWPTEKDDPQNYAAIQALNEGWKARYGAKNASLNPWDPASDLMPYQRMLIAAADYYYAMAVARSRAGTVETIFNPYIVPGYPMDILDNTPSHPSFHAYCSSVTHVITESSISTSVGFVSAMTYTEMANYFTPPVHPWLQVSLEVARKQTIINNSEAKAAADKFYYPTLGIAAADPVTLYDFSTGTVLAVKRNGIGLQNHTYESERGPNGGEANPMLSGIGNLTLTARPIEEKTDVETRHDVKFIDLDRGNYNYSVMKISNKVVLDDKEALEPGQSQWLDYDTD